MARMLTTIAVIAATLALIALPAAAHPHQVTKANGDAGTPGKADGCYATQGPPQERNPAID